MGRSVIWGKEGSKGLNIIFLLLGGVDVDVGVEEDAERVEAEDERVVWSSAGLVLFCLEGDTPSR